MLSLVPAEGTPPEALRPDPATLAPEAAEAEDA